MTVSSPTTHHFLYRARPVASASALLFILYGIVFLWSAYPYGSPYFLWRPDAELVVDAPPPDAAHDYPLQAGDRVLAVDDQPVVRMRPVYPLPLQAAYTFTVDRDGAELTVDVPVSGPLHAGFVSALLPATLLALAGWLAGSVMLLFARPQDRQALHAGLIFLLSAVVLIGIQASLQGAPGAWTAGHAGPFLLAAAWPYLGLLPRETALSPGQRRLFALLGGAALLLAGAAAYETLFLFPQTTGMQALTGVSLYALGFLLNGLGLLACVALMVWRSARLPAGGYLRRQLRILLFFFSLGVVPAMVLTILPRALLDTVLLPFPAAIALLSLIPAGYLFVIHRSGFLGLDVFFSRVLSLITLGLLIFSFYALGLLALQRWLPPAESGALAQATIVFLPTLLLAAALNRPVGRFVARVVYGRIGLGEEEMVTLTTSLSQQPHTEALKAAVRTVAGLLACPTATLLLHNHWGELSPLLTLGAPDPAPIPGAVLDELPAPVVRAAEPAPLPDELEAALGWAEILLPLRTREQVVGLLALSRPGGGYFNARQVALLRQAAAALAVACENAYLLESAQRLARERMISQSEERKHLAMTIHNDHVQHLSALKMGMDELLSTGRGWDLARREVRLRDTVAGLLTVQQGLEKICHNIYRPIVSHGLVLTVKSIVLDFQKTGMAVSYACDFDRVEMPEVKVRAIGHILTEALNNARKHAAGAAVDVALRRQGDAVALTVADDGPGSALIGLPQPELMQRRHMGLVGMYDWSYQIAADLRINSHPGEGTTVHLLCPVGERT